MRTPISLRRTRLLRICIVAAIVVPILYLTLTWSDEKGKSIHSQLFASRSPREAPKLVSGKFRHTIVGVVVTFQLLVYRVDCRINRLELF